MSEKPPDSPGGTRSSDRQRQNVEKMEQKFLEAEKRRQERILQEEMGKRTMIAREGRMHMERKNYVAAMNSYRHFLSITTRMHDTDIGGLMPSHFKEKARVPEALVISSTCWDMLKILDRLKNQENVDERRQIHSLFIRFTKGMPFQHFAAENLRRHLEISKTIVNKQEFWNTYKAIASKGFCIVATWAFDSDSHETVQRLRRFRDEHLRASKLGRMFVRQYYLRGELLVRALAPLPGMRGLMRATLCWIAPKLPMKKSGRHPQR